MTIHWKSDDERFTIHTGDAVAVMRELPAQSCSAIFADPPYFLSKPGGTTNRGGRRVDVSKGSWDLPKNPIEQFSWCMAWLSEARRVLKPEGTIFVSGTLHSVHSTGFAAQTMGLRLLNDITWVKNAPPPNLSCRMFTHSHESILWFSLGPRAKYHFNYAELKAIEGVQMKDVWTFGRPGKDETRRGKHATQKPVALIQRCLLAALPDEGLVLDPFAGSHTTGVAAALGRNRNWRYIGIDLDPEFNEIGRKRILDAITPEASAAAE